jgi:class 3 adenylate cyclase/tetratricopeptide (TPR) repeat protein
VICSNCGTSNEGGRKFCKECASALSVVCSNCGTANAPDAKFCGECASPLPGATATPVASVAGSPRAEPLPGRVAERRTVTVLFADLVGFTPFAEERDAEEVRDTLSRYFELATDIVVRYGGAVEKFIGDAVMAVWGAPAAHEDDAERAVRAGLELVEAVQMLGPAIKARAGVLTGEAAVTIGATNQGMVAGDLVNTASRLQSVASSGAVLVGETTFRAAHGAIVFEEAGQHTLKGKASPVAAWRALRVVAERGGRNRADALEAPFVGREEDLRLLKDLFHATGREERIRLVSVMGPAGIGKSRLAWELLKYVDGLVQSVYYHSGRSPAYGEGITFWALGEMVRARAELLETDDEATTRAKVREMVARWIADEEERRWVEPALLALLGIESGAPSEELFGAWRTFFERISATGPVVLVFEDFHFADTGLLDFVDHLLEWSKGAPIFVITLARPELLDKRADWGAGKRNFHSVVLEPLHEAAMRELIAGLVPGLPEPAARAIVGRADGMPLYAVETVRMLVADGRLRLEADGYVPVGDLASLAVPETLTALIASRLDALDAPERSVLHDAAVLGQSFSLAALSAVSGIDDAALEPRLATLVRRELLTRDVDPRSPELGQYVFVQALIREVEYSTLARKDRKVRHLAAARFFESLGTDELAGALAGHYLAAHEHAVQGAEADALAGQARIALKAAAERAASLGAYDQAVSFLEQALTVTTGHLEQAELLERAGEAAGTAARYDRAENLMRRAVEIRREAGDRLGAARATASLAWALLDGRSSGSALELLETAAAEFADLAPDPVVASLDAHLARAYVDAGQSARAIEAAERVLESAEQRDLLPIVARAFIVKGVALGSLGRKREGIALIGAAEDLARENGLHQNLLGALLVGGYQKGDLDQMAALESYREGLALARRLGHRNMMLRFVNNVGYTGFLAGDWDGALAELEGALAEDLDRGDRIAILCNALIIHACRGESVAEGIAEVERLGAEIRDPGWRITILDVEGNAGLAAGRLEESRRAWHDLARLETSQAPEFLYRAARPALWRLDRAAAEADLEALDVTGVHGRVVEIRRLTIRAGLAALEGHAADALARYRDALRGWRELRLPWDEALTSIDMATLVDPTQPEVQAAGESAREILSRLRASPFLALLDAALGVSGSADTVATTVPAASTRAAISTQS